MLVPILLCGGSGTRLWPLSRRSYPKQFAALTDGESLFQAAARRIAGPGIGKPVVITGSDFRFIVTEQLAAAGVDPGAILIEPDARNTGPAVLAAAMYLSSQDADALMLIMPSDHVIPDRALFEAAVRSGIPWAKAGSILTFGITPTRAETGYGWLEVGEKSVLLAPNPLKLKRFVEKPDAILAGQMLADGGYLWNAGIFLMSARTAMEAFNKYAPALVAPVRASVDQARTDLGFLRLDPVAWGGIEPISLDYAIMEKATNLGVVRFEGAWSDMGDWAAVLRDSDVGIGGTATRGQVTAIDCAGSLLRSESPSLELVGIGLKDLVVIAMPDAVLVADRNRVQEVKQAVERLKSKPARQAETLPRDHRPWGWFETLAIEGRFQVKRIVVHPGAALSLQSHVHRSEHWIVVAGTARVTIDGTISLISENQSIYVPLGATHRLENPGKVQMILIEVQTGAYLGEDDIVRYDDAYSRGQGAKG